MSLMNMTTSIRRRLCPLVRILGKSNVVSDAWFGHVAYTVPGLSVFFFLRFGLYPPAPGHPSFQP